MPTIEYAKQSPEALEVASLAVFAAKGDDGPVPLRDAAGLAGELDVDLATELQAVRFEGQLGGVARIPTRGRTRTQLLLVVGVGPAGEATLETLRRAAGVAARNAARDHTLGVVVPGDLVPDANDEQRARAVAEGAGLGAYAFTTYRSKTDDLPRLEGVRVCAGAEVDGKAVRAGVEQGRVLVEATSLARDLVNEPPQAKRPPLLAERVEEAAAGAGVKVKVHDEKALTKGSFGGLLGVGQGSSAPPRLVELTHDPSRAKGHVVLVGKGITFDSGGLSLKPAASMQTMKCDMAGAAAVTGAVIAAARLGLKVKVTGLLALAENMPSGTALRVADVLTHRGGKTVEVMNTDAEGRLVLADALAYAVESEPDVIVDVATLTGAQVVALGNRVSALFGSDEELVTDLLAAAEEAGEPLWRLPLYDEYRDHLKSEVADLKNIGKPGQAGTIIAALFLREFTGGRPWAHLDIAGPAFTEEGDGYYLARGGTGVPVRTLVRYLERRVA